MSISFALSILMLLSTGCAVQPADASDTADAPRQPSPQDRPAATDAKLTAKSSPDDILDALDRRGENLRSLAADVTLTETDASLGDEIQRTGSFALELRPDGSARSRITFDKKIANNRRTDEKIEYLLDGPNLIDRTYHTKTQVTRQVLRPGEKINLLKLGEGPFPLPIGQDKEEVKRLFDVTKVEPVAGADEPPDTVHVKLVPKAASQFADRFKSIDAWVDLADHMPKRIETVDANEVSIRTTDLSNVRVNADLDDGTFALEKVGEGWMLLNEAYQR